MRLLAYSSTDPSPSPSSPLSSWQTVGRVAQRVSALLLGKGKPTFNRVEDLGDRVTIINAAQVQFTGRRWDRKIYRYHSGFPGGLKEIPARQMLEKHPTVILRKAVQGMLRHNKHRVPRMERLSVWPGEEPPKGKVTGLQLQQVQVALQRRQALYEEVTRMQNDALCEAGGLPELTHELFETLEPTDPVILQRWREQNVKEAKRMEERRVAEEAEQQRVDKEWRDGVHYNKKKGGK